jgi:DNA-binding response OmpR family regulator
MRILIVEDDVRVARSIQAGLIAAGYDVDAAPSAEAAQQKRRDVRYDLLLLDLELPGRNGLQLLEELRSQADPTPVIITTARAELDDRVRGLNGGADDYMIKPVALPELLARVRSIMRRAEAGVGTALRVADLEINPVSRRARRGTRDLELTEREFELLYYLAKNAGKVLSKEAIARDVWNLPPRGAPLDNVIAVHMSHLRQKVDRDAEAPLIRTERGVGFMLCAPGGM